MDEKGGGNQAEKENKNISTNYVNSKIVISVVIVLILGAVFIAGMVYLGNYLSNNVNTNPDTPSTPVVDPEEPVAESIKIDYEEAAADYKPEQENQSSENSLMRRFGVKNTESVIITTASELDDFVTAVNAMDTTEGATPFTYSVNEDFFKTGTIIAIAKEAEGLSSMHIDGVYRDEKYNLHIYGRYAAASDTTEKFGKFSLIQIQNIQPKSVELDWDDGYDPGWAVEKKPIIYLYPTKTTLVNVKLSNPERITVDYPNYNDGWTVTAYPNGKLVTRSGKEFYALYYESQNIKDYKDTELTNGFVVEKAHVEEFLEEKLTILGLDYKEREEFISYWAGELESQPYVYIRFQTKAEIEANMGLQITPKPDTVIRIMMEYKKLDQKVKVQTQKLQPAERKGFTVVEWGGTEVKQ